MTDWIPLIAAAGFALSFTPWFRQVCDVVCPYNLVIQHDELRGWRMWIERRPGR